MNSKIGCRSGTNPITPVVSRTDRHHQNTDAHAFNWHCVGINNIKNWRVDLNMIFCRGCGKQIHETAQNCPQCGATQGNATGKEKYHWASITALISGIVILLIALAEPDGQWDKDTVLGAMILGAIPLSFGLYSFSQSPKNGRWMGITGVILGAFVVLAALGSK
jgi:ribosomal protein L37E